jgi:hypothetical protein
VKTPLAVLIAIFAASVAAWPASFVLAKETPHPAVVRVIAAEQYGSSMGSGALVLVDDRHGMVVTNWHVVRDATGPITVVFPDGFRSGAIVLKIDREWDLAALAIQRPKVRPMTLATEPPRPGESLTIAGYGPDGVYRAQTGRCTEYLSPKENFPAELVEVDVQARRGDSGGPISNSRGEIAGVLFGAGGNAWSGGYTMGSYCGRVRSFLAAAYLDFQRLPGNTTMIAQAPAPLPPPPMTAIAGNPPMAERPALANSQPPSPRVSLEPPVVPRYEVGENSPARPHLDNSSVVGAKNPANSASPNKHSGMAPCAPAPANEAVAQVPSVAVVRQTEQPPSGGEQIKTILAVIGAIAILFHGIRLIGSSVG